MKRKSHWLQFLKPVFLFETKENTFVECGMQDIYPAEIFKINCQWEDSNLAYVETVNFICYY